MRNWKDIIIDAQLSIFQTISVIDQGGLRAALITDESQHLLGMVTDGDIRRAILKNKSLLDPVENIMNQTPTVADKHTSREQLLATLRALSIYHMPLVDEANHLVGFETLDSLLQFSARDNLVIVMAGGVGKRLQPLTFDCPKPLLKIGNKPVLEILLENFIKRGFKHFCFAVNYKAEMIKDYFLQGDQWGVTIDYLEEDHCLGTAGALGLLHNPPALPFFVVNADVVTNIDFQCLLEYHHENQADATICIREHEQIIPYGVVERDEHTHELLSIVEKPAQHFFVNAGIYILNPSILNLLSANIYCDMPDLLSQCVKNKCRVATFPLREYWLDIGRHEDLQKAHLDYEMVF